MPTLLGRQYRIPLSRATFVLALASVFASSGAAAAADTSVSPDESAAGSSTEADRAARPNSTSPATALDEPFRDESNAAEPEAGESDDESPGSPLRALACLEGEGGNDADGARRGVQKRDFLKRHRAEISILGGHYAADALSSTYLFGAAVAAFFSEDFGVEGLVARNPVQFRLEQPFNSFDKQQHFQAQTAWNAMGAFLWSPVHGKLRWSERRITHADVLIEAGAGKTFSETAQGLTFQVGVGVKVYLAKFVSIRFDVRDWMVPQEVLGRGRTTHNVISFLGLSGWFPG